MIVYLNMTGQRMRADEMVEAMEMVQGHVVTGKWELNSKLDIIKLKHARNGKSPLTVKGYQDTRITSHDDGTVVVEHGNPGSGCLRFEADRFMNRVARIARTEHNMTMLTYATRDSQWEILDPRIADEVKLAHDKWWRGLPEVERKAILERERLGKLTPHQVPARWSQHGDQEVDSIIKENSEKDTEIERLREANKNMEARMKAMELQNAAPKPAVETAPTEAPASPEKPLEELTPFALHAILRKAGVAIDRKWSKKYLIELIRGQKEEVAK